MTPDSQNHMPAKVAPGVEDLRTTSMEHRLSSRESVSVDSSPDDAKKEKSEEVNAPPQSQDSEEPQYPPLKKLVVIMAALYMSLFLIMLDRTIIATAIPRITDDFHSLGDVGWYGSAYMLTGCAFQLIMGRVYTFYSPKFVYITCIGIFEIGSAICGAAPNSQVFIFGRAIAGSAASGIFSGAIVIILNVVPLHRRPIFQGLVGAIVGVASVAGPLLGGAFTSNVSWRWCFYINLPIGGAAMVALFFILQIPTPRNAKTPWRQQINQLDPIGTAVFLPAIVCLLLVLEWGGSTYAWSDGRIIALLVLFAILAIAFVCIQYWRKELATIPPRIIKKRSIMAGMWFQFCSGSAMMLLFFYLPIWFQAIKDVSAVKSGIMNLALLLSLVVASIIGGALIHRIGYYTPFVYVCSVLMCIGSGLITTWTPSTGHSQWIGYQVIFGLGLGFGMQQSTLAAQAVLVRKDAPTGIALVMFCQQLGGTIFVSIGQSVFSNTLVQGLAGIPGLDPRDVVNVGATELRRHVSATELPLVLEAYNHALVSTYRGALAMACLSVIGAVFLEWKSIKPKKKAPESVEGEKQDTGLGESVEKVVNRKEEV